MDDPPPGLGLASLDDRERFDWLRLLRCENIGPRTFRVLLDRYGSAGAALAALPALIASGKASQPIRIATVEEVEREVEATHQAGARFVGIGEPDYPALLRRTPSPPPVIAVRGNILSLRRSKIAIVGARNASGAGLDFTAQLARGIARSGHVIVSGLARGIDAKAHQATTETGTIAVLAGGLEKSIQPNMKPCLNSSSNKARRSARCRSPGRPGDATFPAATVSSPAFAVRSWWSRLRAGPGPSSPPNSPRKRGAKSLPCRARRSIPGRRERTIFCATARHSAPKRRMSRVRSRSKICRG